MDAEMSLENGSIKRNKLSKRLSIKCSKNAFIVKERIKKGIKLGVTVVFSLL